MNAFVIFFICIYFAIPLSASADNKPIDNKKRIFLDNTVEEVVMDVFVEYAPVVKKKTEKKPVKEVKPKFAPKPVINERLCKLCGACIKVCPTGTLKSQMKGYRILVGGTFGRMQTLGKEVFRIGQKDDIFKTLDAVVSLIKEKQEDEHGSA